MNVKYLSDTFAVTAQLAPADLREVKAQGFNSVICNRPDFETPDQPTFREIEEVAREAGLVVHYLPVQSGRPSPDDVDQFRKLLESVPKPALAYCRTGTRSAMIYTMSKQAADQAGK
ncbi:TIGR01244 family sulfur transferase [Trinickia sp.]|uniref:TIGR01244 family sulfur transferase n=1 Tax=Trinickia sp. TaxID=2571163 RepID=UPI003F7F0B08